ncbi:hypothetical protein BASA82_000119 [Batrachochytrium salamandrivorans]|nr:hypothetical protein BASA82_000119 [Batrachochytrium salamandrivorans]
MSDGLLVVALAAAAGGKAGSTWEFHVSTRFSSSAVYCHAMPTQEVCFKNSKCLPLFPVERPCVENEVNDLGGVVGIGSLASQNLVLCLSHCDGSPAVEVKHGVGFGDYFYLLEPSLVLSLDSVQIEAKSAVALHCQEGGCPGRRTLSDPAALACFRVDGNLGDFPKLFFSLTANQHHQVLAGDYFYKAEDGSQCIGIFESPNETVIGMNLLVGRRILVDFGNRVLQLGGEGDSVSSELENDTTLLLVSNWIVFVLWGMLCLALGFKLGQWFAFKWRKLPCYKKPASYRKRRALSNRKITFVLPNDPIAVPMENPAQKDNNDGDGEEASLII